MTLFKLVFASALVSITALADTVKNYRGQSSLAPHQCELTVRVADDGDIIGYLLKGPGQLWMSFGVCAETCTYPDLESNMLEPAEFQKYGFRIIRSTTYPQLTFVSRFTRDSSDIFIYRQLEMDLNEAGNPDEIRYQENTEVSRTPTAQMSIRCDHLEEVKSELR